MSNEWRRGLFCSLSAENNAGRTEIMNAIIKTVLIVGTLALAQSSAEAADIKELWTKNCASCHGPDGKGKTKAGRQAGVVDLTDSKVLEKFTDEQMFKRVKEGVKDGDKTKMKPAEQLTDKEIQKLIAYVRTFKK